MTKKKILVCVGTRPNLVKVTQLERCFQEMGGYEYKLLHTGQHFDKNMSDVFFDQLHIRKPDFYLGITGGGHADTVGRIMMAMEPVLAEYRPDMLIVPGDVNSTFACAFAAASQRIPVAHIESGLRSFDMDMPEERNRILTDSISDLLFVTEEIGRKHLLEEGKKPASIHLVGNTIIDAIEGFMPVIDASTVLEDLKLQANQYYVCTFHRPVNVDTFESLSKITDILVRASRQYPVIFPVHPRTLGRLKDWKLYEKLASPAIHLVEPLGYIEFMKLTKHARAVVSDSGGIQAETSYFGIPCFTLRETTELLSTISHGTNRLMPLDADVLERELAAAKPSEAGCQIPLWDGHASERLVQVIHHFL